jgi:hypothetical protein
MLSEALIMGAAVQDRGVKNMAQHLEMDKVRDILIDTAKQQRRVPYGRLLGEFGLSTAEKTNVDQLSDILHEIGAENVRRDEPCLSALVVRAGSDLPSWGFYKSMSRLDLFSGDPKSSAAEEFALSEQQRCFDYWSQTNNETNQNGQVLLEKTGLPSTSHQFAKIWKVQCDSCGSIYGANSCDFHIRRCPSCQRGQPGEPLDPQGPEDRPGKVNSPVKDPEPPAARSSPGIEEWQQLEESGVPPTPQKGQVCFPIVGGGGAGIATVSCSEMHSATSKGIAYVLDFDIDAVEAVLADARHNEEGDKATKCVRVRFSPRTFSGRSYGVALALADKIARLAPDEPASDRLIYATGILPVDGHGAIAGIEGFAEKVAFIEREAPPGSLFIFPRENYDTAPDDTRLLLERMASGKQIECRAVDHIDDLSDLWTPGAQTSRPNTRDMSPPAGVSAEPAAPVGDQKAAASRRRRLLLPFILGAIIGLIAIAGIAYYLDQQANTEQTGWHPGHGGSSPPCIALSQSKRPCGEAEPAQVAPPVAASGKTGSVLPHSTSSSLFGQERSS